MAMATLTDLPSSASITWDLVTPPPPSPVSQYQVVYRPLHSTTVQFKNVSLMESQTTLTGLQYSAMYEFYVRLVCSDDGSESGDGGGVGPLSERVTLALPDASMFCLAS